MKPRLPSSLLVLAALPLAYSVGARAQSSTPAAPAAPAAPVAPVAPPPVSPPPQSAPSGGTSNSVSAGGVTSQAVPFGGAVYMPPGTTFNPNAHLSAGSQPTLDIDHATDGFNYGTQGGGAAVLRGNENAPGILGSKDETAVGGIPPVHTVRRGDTLWDICGRYFNNPWEWPRIWGYNPDLSNPHWIYPGDQIRMQGPGGLGPTVLDRGNLAFVGRRRTVPKTTVFLRDQGYIDDEVKDVWGTVGGSPDDQMLLTEGDNAYLEMAPGHDVSVGQELTIFQPLRKISGGTGKGTIVSILGTAKVENWDPKTRVARAALTESLNAIERGAKIGPVGRRFDIIPPVKNDVELNAHVIAAMYPHALFGQNQVVFIDKGEKDGLVAGNRLFAIVQGDAYAQTLKGSSPDGTSQVRYEADKHSTIVKNPDAVPKDDSKYPREVIGEIRVLRTREHTAACLVLNSAREFETGQLFVARKGY